MNSSSKPVPQTYRDAIAASGYTCAKRYSRVGKIAVKCPAGHLVIVSFDEFENGDRCPKGCTTARTRKPRVQSMKRWALKVIEKAGRLCQCCKDKDAENLEAHHLYAYEAYPEHRHKLENGMCVCRKCHTEFHAAYGYGENTPQQMTEFLKNRTVNDG